MTKLSPAQAKLLRRFGEGEILTEHHFGPDAWLSWHDDSYGRPGIRWDTLWSLQEKSLIRATTIDWRTYNYAITDAGQAYLEGL